MILFAGARPHTDAIDERDDLALGDDVLDHAGRLFRIIAVVVQGKLQLIVSNSTLGIDLIRPDQNS
ncbi:MAG TPA: hypothetical protein VJ698_15895 [Noviherbaspirillum sp.]|uniref:hypothetical protein n=1 Tax=Noviherbaspirillum sp. TaxID=1926288 RepID=UPI002B4A2D33|nr:hypothetical protein [Noviherbaspirillum sp.]HJV86949.1 hypothetical protein [Noviherbaspirillum sp.]